MSSGSAPRMALCESFSVLYVCVCVCVKERAGVRVCVCVCERERESEIREREKDERNADARVPEEISGARGDLLWHPLATRHL